MEQVGVNFGSLLSKKNSIQLKSHFCDAETNFGMHEGKVELPGRFTRPLMNYLLASGGREGGTLPYERGRDNGQCS